ncbi:MAG: 17 kDa surface antigen [Betaproteobacteria bacterium]|nr:17 kDa surface antigen [Betaproteobacteria bacterium]
MNHYQHAMFAATLIAACLLPAMAQDYRYPSGDTAPQTAQQQAPVQPQVQAPVQVQPPVAAQPPCSNCGTVDSIRTIEKAGEGSAVGMIAGGVLGGLLGHQIGRGSGNTAATIIGAAGGAYAGNQVEKNVKKVLHYDVSVRMDDGSLRTVNYDVEPGFRTGDKVRFIDGRLTRN